MARPNRSGIDWSDPDERRRYFQERHAAYAAGARPNRALGRRSRDTVRVLYRPEIYTYEVRIGRALYESIGAPPFVTLDRYRSFVTIHACSADWRGACCVDGQRLNTAPT